MRPIRAFQPAPIRTHFILVDWGHAIGQGFAEAPHNLSFEDAVKLIASGEYDDVRIVFAADQADGTFLDVTSDVADALAKRDWDDLSRAAQALCQRFDVVPEPDPHEDRYPPAVEHAAA